MTNKMYPSIVVAIVIVCALSLNAAPSWAAKIYRWVDEEGVTHYSANQPSDRSTETEILKMKPTQKPRSNSEENSTEDQDPMDSDETVNADSNDNAELNPEELAKIKKEEQANCTKARKNLYTLNNRSRIVAPDKNNDGSKRYLSDQELAKWKAESTRVVEEYCK